MNQEPVEQTIAIAQIPVNKRPVGVLEVERLPLSTEVERAVHPVVENSVLALILEKTLREFLLDGRTVEVWPCDLDRSPLRRLALFDNHS